MQVNMSRNRLSKLMGNTIQSSSLATEMIKYQNNDPIVDDLVDTFEFIRKKVVANAGKTLGTSLIISHVLLADSEVMDKITELEDKLYKRFGIHIRFNADAASFNAAAAFSTFGFISTTQYVSSNLLYRLANNYDAVFERIISAVKTVDTKLSELLGGIWSRGVFGSVPFVNMGTTANILLQSTNNSRLMTNKGLLKGIKFDLNKAYISGIPDDVEFRIMMDFTLFTDAMSSRSMAGLFMHEFGHIWTFIEYSVKHVYNTGSLIDGMIESTKKGMSPRETLVYLAEINDADKETLDAIKKGNMTAAFLGFSGVFCTNNLYPRNDLENLADRFAARFGLGADLTLGLKTITTVYGGIGLFTDIAMMGSRVTNPETPCINSIFYPYWLLKYIFLLILSNPVNPIKTLVTVTWNCVIRGVLSVALGRILVSIVGSGSIAGFNSGIGVLQSPGNYDEYFTRLRRIKHEIIRSLRSTQNLPDDIKEKMLKDIELIEIEESARVNPATAPIISFTFDKVVEFFRCPIKYLKSRKYENLDKELEVLMENNLHVAHNRLSLLRKGR